VLAALRNDFFIRKSINYFWNAMEKYFSD